MLLLFVRSSSPLFHELSTGKHPNVHAHRALFTTLTVLIAASLLGCGNDPEPSANQKPVTDKSKPASTKADYPPCPKGTPAVGIDDVLPTPPPGFKVIVIDPAEAEKMNPVQALHGVEGVKSIEASLVLKQGQDAGTLVFIANLKQRGDDRPEDILRGTARGSQTGFDVKPRKIQMAGYPAALLRLPPPNGTRINGLVGTCAIAMLADADERRVRRLASRIKFASE